MNVPICPDSFVRVIERALEQDPERRFASAGELERALSTISREAKPESWWQRFIAALRARTPVRVLSVACVAALVALAVGGSEIIESWVDRNYTVEAGLLSLPRGRS